MTRTSSNLHLVEGLPAIHTRVDLDLWLDGFDAGTKTTLRTLATVPAGMLPAVIAAMAAELPRPDNTPGKTHHPGLNTGGDRPHLPK